MSSQDERDWKSLMAAADKHVPAVAEAFRTLVGELMLRYTVDEITTALEQGRIDALINGMMTAPEITEFKAPIQAAILSFAETETASLRPRIVVGFDRYSTAAVQAVQDQGASLVKQITNEMRVTIQTLVSDGIRHGDGTRVVAARIRQMIGLTAKQAQSVVNYQRMLENQDPRALDRLLRDKRFDRTLIRSVRGGEKLSEKQIADQVEALRQRTITFRANTIARNEMIVALQSGQRAAWTQVLEQSDDILYVVRFWYVAKDERVCEICTPVPRMNPQGRGFGEPFTTPIGAAMGPVLHIKCRCVVFVRPVFA